MSWDLWQYQSRFFVPGLEDQPDLPLDFLGPDMTLLPAPPSEAQSIPVWDITSVPPPAGGLPIPVAIHSYRRRRVS